MRPQRDTSEQDESVSRVADGTLNSSPSIAVPDDRIISKEDECQAPTPAEAPSDNNHAADKALRHIEKLADEVNIVSAPSAEEACARDGPEHITLPDVSAHSLSGLDESIASDAEAGSGAAGDEHEQTDIDSIPSGGLDCTSTPVAIGQDPFAGGNGAHEAAGPVKHTGPEADSRCLAPSCAVILP